MFLWLLIAFIGGTEYIVERKVPGYSGFKEFLIKEEQYINYVWAFSLGLGIFAVVLSILLSYHAGTPPENAFSWFPPAP